MKPSSQNLVRLRKVVQRLGTLAERFVLVGGSATELLVTDRGSSSPRNTVDVDFAVDTKSFSEWNDMERQLRQLGFTNDTSEGAPMCRWRCGEDSLDVVSTGDSGHGPRNRWYAIAHELAVTVDIGHALSIRVVTAPCFVATKLEAFKNRGHADFVASHDLEDIIEVIQGRETIEEDIARTDPRVREFIAREFGELLSKRAFREALPGHLESDSSSQARAPLVVKRMSHIAVGHDAR